MTDTNDATPRPNDMPEMMPDADERALSFLGDIMNYISLNDRRRAITALEAAFRDGVLAERARSLNEQIKTALADGERDGRQLAEDCRITPEAANTPCYVPPNSTNLAERSRTPEPGASALELAVKIYQDIFGHYYRKGLDIRIDTKIERIATVITLAETAAREAAAQEMLRRFGETPMGNVLAAAIRSLAE